MERGVRDGLIQHVTELLGYLAVEDTPSPCDIIWALGSNDEKVPREAARLYLGNMAPLVLFSGGKGHRWTELAKAEADVFKEVAARQGVPEQAMIIENQSSNTGENVTFSLSMLDSACIVVASALLITIPPFQRRAHLTVETHRKSIRCVNSPISWGAARQWDNAFLVHAAMLCAGEIERLQKYPGLGYIDFDPNLIPARIRECRETVADLLEKAKPKPSRTK